MIETPFLTMPLTDAERHLLTPPTRPQVLDWARKNFVLSKMTSDVAGLWSDDYTPYLKTPLERISAPPVEVFIEACTQAGKTTLELIILGYLIDQDPGPTLFLLPQQAVAERRINTRVRPMFADNPRLLEHLGGDLRTLNIGKETILDNMILYVAWATSEVALSDSPAQNVLVDEMGKFRMLDRTGENPIDLIRKRQRTFLFKRLVGVSSPQDADDIADAEFRSGSDERWHVPCPRCGRWHRITAAIEREAYVVLDRDSRDEYLPAAAYKAGGKARYVCPHCRDGWTEMDRWKANSAGVWVDKACAMDPNGKLSGTPTPGNKYSYRVDAAMLHPRFFTIGELAAEFAAAGEQKRLGNLEKLRDFVRNQQARPWTQSARAVSGELLRAKRNGTAAGLVPAGVRVLVLGADFHQDSGGNQRIDYLIKGFGEDMVNCDIQFGSVGSFEELEQIALVRAFVWETACDIPPLTVMAGFVDSGYEPDIVYDFCRRWRRLVYPVKGGTGSQKTPFIASDLDAVVRHARAAGRRRYAGGYEGMKLLTLNVNHFKDIVSRMAEAPLGSPASTSYCQDMPDYFFEELTNEHRVLAQKGSRGGQWVWKPKSDGKPTHALDVSVYATAAGYFIGANTIASPQAQALQAEMTAARRQSLTPPAANRPLPARRKHAGGGWLDNLPTL
jgi:terminase, large subunit